MAFREAAGPPVLGVQRARPGPVCSRRKPCRAREESKSGCSNNVNNDSSGGGSGANKDDSKSEGNINNNGSGCANSSMCEGKDGH